MKITEFLSDTVSPANGADQAGEFLRSALLPSPDFRGRDFRGPSDSSTVLYSFW